MKRKILIGVSIIFGIFILYFFFGIFTEFNYFTAKRDISKGNIRIVYYGEPDLEVVEMANQILEPKYGFHYFGKGCVVDPAIDNGMSFYNTVMRNHLIELNGKDWEKRFENEKDSIISNLLIIEKVLIGNWGMFETQSYQKNNDSTIQYMTTKCNACPKLAFNKDYSGTIKGGNGAIFAFNWDIESGKLNFTNSIETSPTTPIYKILQDGIYEIVFSPGEKIEEVILIDSKKNKYLLSKIE